MNLFTINIHDELRNLLRYVNCTCSSLSSWSGFECRKASTNVTTSLQEINNAIPFWGFELLLTNGRGRTQKLSLTRRKIFVYDITKMKMANSAGIISLSWKVFIGSLCSYVDMISHRLSVLALFHGCCPAHSIESMVLKEQRIREVVLRLGSNPLYLGNLIIWLVSWWKSRSTRLFKLHFRWTHLWRYEQNVLTTEDGNAVEALTVKQSLKWYDSKSRS